MQPFNFTIHSSLTNNAMRQVLIHINEFEIVTAKFSEFSFCTIFSW